MSISPIILADAPAIAGVTGHAVSTLATSVPLECCAITLDGKTIVAGDSLGAVHFLEWVGESQRH